MPATFFSSILTPATLALVGYSNAIDSGLASQGEVRAAKNVLRVNTQCASLQPITQQLAPVRVEIRLYSQLRSSPMSIKSAVSAIRVRSCLLPLRQCKSALQHAVRRKRRNQALNILRLAFIPKSDCSRYGSVVNYPNANYRSQKFEGFLA